MSRNSRAVSSAGEAAWSAVPELMARGSVSAASGVRYLTRSAVISPSPVGRPGIVPLAFDRSADTDDSDSPARSTCVSRVSWTPSPESSPETFPVPCPADTAPVAPWTAWTIQTEALSTRMSRSSTVPVSCSTPTTSNGCSPWRSSEPLEPPPSPCAPTNDSPVRSPVSRAAREPSTASIGRSHRRPCAIRLP